MRRQPRTGPQDRRLLALSRGTLQLLSRPAGEDFAAHGPLSRCTSARAVQFGATRLTTGISAGAALGGRPSGTRTWCTRWHAPQRADPNIVVHRPSVIGLSRKSITVLIRLDDCPAHRSVHSDQRQGGAANGADGRPAAGDALLAELDVDGLAPAPPLSVHARGAARAAAVAGGGRRPKNQ